MENFSEDVQETKSPSWRLGEILLQKGWVKWDDLETALAIQKATSRPLGEILISRGLLRSSYLFEALAIQFGKKFVDLKTLKIQGDAVQCMPRHLAYEYKIMPLAKQKDILLVAISDPMDAWALSMVEKLTNVREVQSVIATPDDIREAIETYYGREGVSY